MKSSLFQINIIGDKLFSNSSKAFSLEDSKNFGERKEGKIIYSSYEAYYLYNRKDCEIVNNNKVLNNIEILRHFLRSDKDFNLKYSVYSTLRSRGYIVKTGLKFGGEFRVYEKHNLVHAKWICYSVKSSRKISWEDIISKARVSHSTAKKLLIAIVDEDVLFYELDWVKI